MTQTMAPEKTVHGKPMKKEQTLSIVKPDAIAKNYTGQVIALLEKAGLQVVAAKMMHMSKAQAEGFYAVHKERPFYQELVRFMMSGPVLVMVLEGDNAVLKNRDIMGATDPRKAAPGTIRALFGNGIEENVVHGSDSLENAQKEISFFFTEKEICPRTR